MVIESSWSFERSILDHETHGNNQSVHSNLSNLCSSLTNTNNLTNFCTNLSTTNNLTNICTSLSNTNNNLSNICSSLTNNSASSQNTISRRRRSIFTNLLLLNELSRNNSTDEEGRTFWTKYCLLCTLSGTAATFLSGIFLIIAALFRYYTTSVYYFETVPTYIPAILLSICGVSTICFSCKRNRNLVLLRITACWSLISGALSSVITITTSLIHMNRLQTLKECVYSRNPPMPTCTCFTHSSLLSQPLHFVFENTGDCDVIHGPLYSCLRALFAVSVLSLLLSIFLAMLLYQLIAHERKKAYWSRIRRLNSEWNSHSDFLSCLTRPMIRREDTGSTYVPHSFSDESRILNSFFGPPPPYNNGENINNLNNNSVPHSATLPNFSTIEEQGSSRATNERTRFSTTNQINGFCTTNQINGFGTTNEITGFRTTNEINGFLTNFRRDYTQNPPPNYSLTTLIQNSHPKNKNRVLIPIPTQLKESKITSTFSENSCRNKTKNSSLPSTPRKKFGTRSLPATPLRKNSLC